jgi:DNA uptake protein ComE-like DNA-binding protein
MLANGNLVRLIAAFMLIGYAGAFAGDQAAVLNPNSAGKEQLRALPHLAAAEVAALVSARPFATIGELNAVLSVTLGAEQLEELYGKLFVPVNLNTASEADILLIPGVGKRMAHEFEEYRPYRSMEQFRREIGKYVDDAEVARLEMYVTLD